MLFNSLEFLLFLPIVFGLYWFVFKKTLNLQNLLILTASYFFYGWWSYKFLGLLALSTLLDYCYGFWVASPNRKKAKFFLWLSIINNLGILGIFKYYNFFAEQFQAAFELVGIHTDPMLIQVALPVGISFYTFHGMSYVFDIYRGLQKPVKNYVDYAVFVSFFPLLVAGPIERASHLLPQVQQKRVFNYKQAVDGCRLILWGMLKKVIVADMLAETVDSIYGNYQNESAFTVIIGAISFSFQIYCDFSGYSDIALGTAKLFGFELLSNFKFPYFSRDIAEFWRRWHISLSSWFRDYLYIPLGGSKLGKLISVRNIFVIFLVSGFWHGASWNFIVWGFIHACGFLPLLLLNRNRKNVTAVVAQNSYFPSLKELFQMVVTFIFVTFAWIFFRADTIQTSIGIIKHIVVDSIQHPTQFLHAPGGLMALLFICPLVIVDWYLRRDERRLRIFGGPAIFRWVVYLAITFAFFFQINKSHMENKVQNFIYFQF